MARTKLCPLTFASPRLNPVPELNGRAEARDDRRPPEVGEVFGCMGSRCLWWEQIEERPAGWIGRCAVSGVTDLVSVLPATVRPGMYSSWWHVLLLAAAAAGLSFLLVALMKGC